MHTARLSLRTRKCGIKSDKGFTLVEVLVASLLLVTVFLACIATLQQGFLVLDTARNTTMADQILQSDLEDIRLLSWAKISTLPVDTPTSIPLGAADLSHFSATRTISNVADRNSNMKKITETVTWTDYKGRVHNRTYSTIFTHFGLNDYFVTSRTY